MTHNVYNMATQIHVRDNKVLTYLTYILISSLMDAIIQAMEVLLHIHIILSYSFISCSNATIETH